MVSYDLRDSPWIDYEAGVTKKRKSHLMPDNSVFVSKMRLCNCFWVRICNKACSSLDVKHLSSLEEKMLGAV